MHTGRTTRMNMESRYTHLCVMTHACPSKKSVFPTLRSPDSSYSLDLWEAGGGLDGPALHAQVVSRRTGVRGPEEVSSRKMFHSVIMRSTTLAGRRERVPRRKCIHRS